MLNHLLQHSHIIFDICQKMFGHHDDEQVFIKGGVQCEATAPRNKPKNIPLLNGKIQRV